MRFVAILFAFTVFFAQFLSSDSHQLNQPLSIIEEGKVQSEGAHQNALQMMVAAEGHRTRRHQKRAVETDAELEGQTCKIKVQKVEVTKGKCVKLRGGMRGCQTSQYLDPDNADCTE